MPVQDGQILVKASNKLVCVMLSRKLSDHAKFSFKTVNAILTTDPDPTAGGQNDKIFKAFKKAFNFNQQ
ncbi:MAG TPA: hypothetical protein VF181_07725 [Balneolaceae bacterium]